MTKQRQITIAVSLLVLLLSLFFHRGQLYSYFANGGRSDIHYSALELDFATAQRTKTENCEARGPLPDPECTPGGIFLEATVEQICTPGYSRSVRNVSAATKKEVYREYGLSYPQGRGEYEADHHVPLELGGNNEIANLWPEPRDPRPGYHEKDLVENFLHDEVCAGRVDLLRAQQQIAVNWLEVYNQFTRADIYRLEQQFRNFGN